jgi:hypothetical protein
VGGAKGAVDSVERVRTGRNEDLKALVEELIADGTDRHNATSI